MTVATNNEKAKAKDAMINSIRDLETVKITLPLGNPDLKLVHTNQFLFTDLPTSIFELANMPVISKALNGSYSRYSGYQVNRWYIEGVTITHDSNGSKMELELNPFASTLNRFADDKNGFEEAYKQAFEKSTSTTSTSSSSKKVASANTVSFKNVKGFSKSDQKYIIKIVAEAFMKAKNPKKDLDKAKAIYSYYNKNHVYNSYSCMKKMKAHGFEYTWKKKGHNCGDGAATIVAMMKCANLDADIMHKPGHFYVRVKIKGKYYYCDQAGASGKRNTRTLGSKGNNKNVFGGISKSASVVGFKYC